MNKWIYLCLFLLPLSISSASAETLPFTAPSSFTSEPTGTGEEGSRHGDLSHPDREYTITYSYGGAFARTTKRPLRDYDSIDSIFYYNETQIEGVEVQLVGLRVRNREDQYRLMLWVPARETYLSVYVTGRPQVERAIADLMAFKFNAP